MENIIYKLESYKIIGACMEVQNHLGKGFSEIVYKDALELEFNRLKIPYTREQEFEVKYKGKVLPHKFYADFVVWNKIIVEVKNVTHLSQDHIAQTFNYLAVSKSKLGILVNFRSNELEYKRIVL